MRFLQRCLLVVLLSFCPAITLAQPATQPTTQPTAVQLAMQSLDERLKKELSPEQLIALNEDLILSKATPEERTALSIRYISVRVNVPVDAYAMVFASTPAPFWLSEQGFTSTGQHVQVQTRKYAVWKKAFDAGEIGIGMHSFDSDGPQHLYLALKPRDASQKLEVTDVPPRAKLDTMNVGVHVHADRIEKITECPAELVGATLVRPHSMTGRVTKLIGKYRMTKFPSSNKPDHITLTWSEDPKTTQTIQWRAKYSQLTSAGPLPKVEYGLKSSSERQTVSGEISAIDEETTLNDPRIFWLTVVLRGLKPGETYAYRVHSNGEWSNWFEFRSAPAADEKFTFCYLGDAQNGLDEVGKLLNEVHQRHPEIRFYLFAGDLVEDGDQLDNWDEFFGYAKDLYAQRPIVPVIGNHDVIGGGPRLYLNFFGLPTDGPAGMTERVYTLSYGSAMLAILDSNLGVSKEAQAPWLKEKLLASSAPWKFTSYHHPCYSGTPGEKGGKLRDLWSPVMENNGVNMALQGHVHAYFRTHPIRDGKNMERPIDGTTYCVTVCGTKTYASEDKPYSIINKTHLRTYQLITVDPKRLEYKAYDDKHQLFDELTIEK